MLQLRATTVQTKPTLAVPRGGQAEPRATVTFTDAKPKGIVHMVGGAVVGAAPQLTYKALVERMARSGYAVVQTPYPFTFEHAALAKDLRETFVTCLRELRAQGQAALVPDDVPVHGVGHSNGALMHALIASYYAEPVTSNVLMSFNNKEVADAIPVPGFIENVRPLLEQGRRQGLARSPEEVRDACIQALNVLPVPLPASAVAPTLSQLSSCLMEIEGGTVDFVPTPAASRDTIAAQYSVGDTLLLRFEGDGIDESPQLARLLGARRGARVVEQALPGSHIAPCGDSGGVNFGGGLSFTPADVLGMVAGALTSGDRDRASDAVVRWLDRF